jgi:hypothetical protein
MNDIQQVAEKGAVALSAGKDSAKVVGQSVDRILGSSWEFGNRF